MLKHGFTSNFGSRRSASHVHVSATMDAAVWGAELAEGAGGNGSDVVEPHGGLESPGNATKTSAGLGGTLQASGRGSRLSYPR